MPWRKAWLDPRSRSQTETDAQQLRRLLERRAYEVWISEIMLQQTRVAVVIDYWNRWMARWPTIQDLAEATADHVLAAWRGLGYYSRATRIHEAAKLVVGDEQMRGLLPADVAELQAKMPGVGRYTAGAISAIVFGRAAAMVDGNVLRVLSRQLGVLGDVKADKAVVDVMWAAATALVQAVAADPDQNEKPESDADAHTTPPASDRPGRWGQALMELGSTVCTPKPNCSACPISTTCRAFDEGVALAGHAGEDGDTDLSWSGIDDIEEPCTLCGALGDPAEPDVTGPGATKGTRKKGAKSTSKTEAQTLGMIADHARKFPLKAVKKAVREEERLVCIIKCGATGDYLIQRRPGTGLLAGLWEFPSLSVTDGDASSAKRCVARARSFVDDLVQGHVGDEAGRGSGGTVVIEGGARLGSVPWLFSHLKLTMHVHGFVVNGGLGGMDLDMDMDMEQIRGERRWASSEAVEQESMGTGMRRCWQLARDEEAPGC